MDLRKPTKSKLPRSTASFSQHETGYYGHHYKLADAKPAEPAASRFPTKEQRQGDQDIVVRARRLQHTEPAPTSPAPDRTAEWCDFLSRGRGGRRGPESLLLLLSLLSGLLLLGRLGRLAPGDVLLVRVVGADQPSSKGCTPGGSTDSGDVEA